MTTISADTRAASNLAGHCAHCQAPLLPGQDAFCARCAPIENARAVAADALKLFKRSRTGVPGLAKVLAEFLHEVLVEYDAAVRRADDLGQRLETVRAIIDGDDGEPDNGVAVVAPVEPEEAPETVYLLGGPLDGSKLAVRHGTSRVEVDLPLEQGGGAAVYDSLGRRMADGSWVFVYRRRRPVPFRTL